MSDPAGPARARALAVLAFLLPLAVYVAPGRYQQSGDTAPAELLPIAILHGHGVDLGEFANTGGQLPYYLRNLRGHIISAYPVVPGFLNVPVYAVADALHVNLMEQRARLSLITTATLVAFSVLFLFFTLRQMSGDPRHAFWFALLYAFGTNAWSNGAVSLFQHGASLFFLTAAIACLVRPDGRAVPWAGLLLGLAVWNRPTNFVFAAVLTLYVVLHRRRSLLPFLALAAIPAALLAAYSHAYWGSVRALGLAQGGWGFDGNVATGLAGLLVSPSRGLFVFSPIFLFGAIEGVRRLRRRSDDPLLEYLFAAAVLLILLTSKWGNWWGGHSYSYRLLTEVSPAFILLAAAAWRGWIRDSGLARLLFLAAAAFSIVIQAFGVRVFPTRFNDDIDFEPARLWSWSEGELATGVRRVLARVDLGAREGIPGWCDSPADHSVVHGALVVDGWAQSPKGEVEVRVVLDAGRAVAVVDRYPRPDVAAALGRLGDTSRAGWRVSIPYVPGGPAVHEVSVELRTPDGRVRRLPTLHVRWEPR